LIASRNELGRLAERLILEEEEEHRLVAVEVGSDFAQKLANLLAEMTVLEKELLQVDPKFGTRLRILRKQVAKISADARALSERLHPSVLEENDLIKAIQEECTRFSRRRRINVQLVSQNVPEEVPGYVAFSLYRILQESLCNVATHARTRRVHVSLTGGNGLIRLSIRDKGVGFDPASVQNRKGLGLAGIQERTRLIRGKCTVDSAPGRGTSVSVEVPAVYSKSAVPSSKQPKLTQRQIDVLRLLAHGHVAKQIAASLNISTKTVEFHKYRIMQILGVKTVADLIRFAVKHDLVIV
jgi:signal transduction histidine kinase/DNA-binding CsgD family transcriptional regulator